LRNSLGLPAYGGSYPTNSNLPLQRVR